MIWRKGFVKKKNCLVFFVFFIITVLLNMKFYDFFIALNLFLNKALKIFSFFSVHKITKAFMYRAARVGFVLGLNLMWLFLPAESRLCG